MEFFCQKRLKKNNVKLERWKRRRNENIHE
jgi:hypothetical protein